MDLISLIVALIIISLLGIGLMLALIIMSQEKDVKEQEYEKQAEIQFIHDYQLKKEQKRQARKALRKEKKDKKEAKKDRREGKKERREARRERRAARKEKSFWQRPF